LVPVIVSLGVQMAARLMPPHAKDDLEATKFTTGTGTNEPQGLTVGAITTSPARAGWHIRDW
jgi:hypothetical protein